MDILGKSIRIFNFSHFYIFQVEERRRDIEKSEQERREAILARNKERESRLETQRRSSIMMDLIQCGFFTGTPLKVPSTKKLM